MWSGQHQQRQPGAVPRFEKCYGHVAGDEWYLHSLEHSITEVEDFM